MARGLVRLSIRLAGLIMRTDHQSDPGFFEPEIMNSSSNEMKSLVGEKISDVVPLAGGSINQVYRLTINNEYYCLKRNDHAPADFFLSEQLGLEALSESCAVKVPNVVKQGPNFLLLQWIDSSSSSISFSEQLGRELAALHKIHRDSFGFDRDNYCGETPQSNTLCDSGYDFFARHRIQHQADLAVGKGLLSKSDLTLIESIGRRLDQFIPEQPASLLHGDLWNGNVIFSASGPVLIDPAVYYGWAEADLAMTRLFGGFDAAFYDSYREVNPVEPGFEERVPLYNLYHLLNHLNLFGSGWYPSVTQVVRRFSS